MATTTGFDYGVRQGLVSKGINNDDIGYNPSTGYVTVNGQNFIKPEKNYSGTTYTSSQNFNNAWNEYQKSLNNATSTGSAGTVNTGYPPTTSYNSYNTQNPYDQQLNSLIQMLAQQAQQPMSVDVNQIYASPQYAAYQAQAQRGAQQGIRAAQESMGASGFGRSTALAERAQGIQNDATNYLNTQVLPQLIAQAQAERQQQLLNQFSVLDQLVQQQGLYDDRFNQNRQFGLQEGQLTGQYLTDRDRQAMPLLEQLIAYGNEFGTANPQRQAELRAAADANRAALGNMGIDPSLYDPNLSTEQRIAALSRLGTPTLAAQNQQFNQAADQRDFEYQQLRDQILDERDKRNFDEDVRQFGVNDAWRRYQEKQVAARAASRGSSSGSGGSSSGSSNGVIRDLNMPTTVSSMVTWIKNNMPGVGKVEGPPPPDMLQQIERLILSNPNFSDKQYEELYQKFGIPLE